MADWVTPGDRGLVTLRGPHGELQTIAAHLPTMQFFMSTGWQPVNKYGQADYGVLDGLFGAGTAVSLGLTPLPERTDVIGLPTAAGVLAPGDAASRRAPALTTQPGAINGKPLALGDAFISGGGGGGGVSAAISTVLASFFGISFGGMGRAISGAFSGLRNGLVDITNVLANFAFTIAHSLRYVLNALRAAWDRIIKPALAHLDTLTKKIARIIDRVLGPYLQTLQRIRKILLDTYEKVFRPMIETIQKFRQVLSVLKVLRVPGVKQLDAKLRKIEAKLIEPILALLQRTNEHSGLINILLNTRRLLQKNTLGWSLHSYRSSFTAMWWNEQSIGLDDSPAPPGPVLQPAVAAMEIKNSVAAYAISRSGPIAASTSAVLDVFREAING